MLLRCPQIHTPVDRRAELSGLGDEIIDVTFCVEASETARPARSRRSSIRSVRCPDARLNSIEGADLKPAPFGRVSEGRAQVTIRASAQTCRRERPV